MSIAQIRHLRKGASELNAMVAKNELVIYIMQKARLRLEISK
jgi:hypothetical protein